MRFRVIFDSKPIRKLRQFLGERDFRYAWDGVRDVLRVSIAQIFASQGNGRWQRLSRETLRWREDLKVPAGPILDVPGGRHSLKNAVLSGDKDSVNISKRQSFELGSTLGYAGLHQFGGEVQQPTRSKLARKAFKTENGIVKRIPARPFLTAGGTVSEPDLDEATGGRLAETFAESLANKIAGLFGGH